MALSVLQYCGDRSVRLFLWMYDVLKPQAFKAKSVFFFNHRKAE